MIDVGQIKRIASHVGNRAKVKNKTITEPYLLRGLSSSKFIINSRTGTSQQIAKLVEDLRILLGTEKGTLFGRPDYGTDLIKYLFEPTVETMGEKIRQEIVNTIQYSYPSMHIEEANIEFIKTDPDYPEVINGIRVYIYYSVNQNNFNQLLSFDIMREHK